MKLAHPALINLLQRAYSAEKAAAYAYIGHAHSMHDVAKKAPIQQIEADEWHHRECVLAIMQQYEVPISKWYELKFAIIGKSIAFLCHVIGWFMPYFFAGRLESGNVCEYLVMMRYFHELDIHVHDDILYEMAIKEKEHEVFFMDVCKKSKLLPYFEKVFAWGENKSLNDVDIENKYPVSKADAYCKK